MTGPEFYKAAAEALDDAEGRMGDCTPGESAIALAMIGVGRATGRLKDAAEHTWHGNCAIGAPCRGSL